MTDEIILSLFFIMLSSTCWMLHHPPAGGCGRKGRVGEGEGGVAARQRRRKAEAPGERMSLHVTEV